MRPPPPEGRHYTQTGFAVAQEFCRSPYEVPADAPVPATVAEARMLYEGAKADVRTESVTGAFITAEVHDVAADRFAVEADNGHEGGEEEGVRLVRRRIPAGDIYRGCCKPLIRL